MPSGARTQDRESDSAAKYNLSSRDILLELGRRRTVGGQEDMIEDLALDMARKAGTI